MSRSFLPYSAFALVGIAMAEPFLALNSDFPDPSLIETSSGYYAFGTSGNGVNAQVATSPDFNTWTLLSGTDALPGPFPSWVASSPTVWAPDVLVLGDGSYVMYFSAAAASDSGKHCVGAATATSPEGPYAPVDSVLACPLDQGGAIDANGFIDSDGTIYVVYKVDGNSLDGDGTTHSTPIMLQKLESDGTTPTGDPVQLIDRSDLDGPLIEAPSLLLSNGIFYLSFSSNWYNTEYYDTSYAYATSITGPWTKQSAPYAPLLVTGTGTSNDGSLSAPGGADFSTDGTKILFHANLNGQDISGGRALFAASISEANDVVTLQ
ncbi:endo xylanase, putative [Talaromyces stipitatus ATCC 10500]|uniref:Endo xylanase, putative n=1 Tax=Talaromyces stipitatus (strain ATCC 10500 / CBS 375.48 / QM 6759 / NRRL 1006) TaxID=441959 RepID=B8MML3_TALSN|nr:endo xylanase, putative [Talaromyces stipitatus ATCC 10500]EED13769.1 endo xylanase, putative [Talaromyces stipitatus ATCC 10500]